MANGAPIAFDDEFIVQQGSQFSGNLGVGDGNGIDFDPDGDLLGWASAPVNFPYGASFSSGVLGWIVIEGTVSYPHPVFRTTSAIVTEGGGMVTLQSNGNFTYRPALGFSGEDSFDYTLIDEFFSTDIGHVTIDVKPVAGAVHGSANADILNGTSAADTIFGYGGNDKLSGGKGADKLIGGAGADVLTGGGGPDQFVFDAPGGSVDKVRDFSHGIDKVVFAAADYGFMPGALPDASYFSLAAGAADVGHARFLYDKAAATLLFDADGQAATANVSIATFNASAVLTGSDFLMM